MTDLPSKTGTTYYGQPSISSTTWTSSPDNCLETIAGADDGDYGYVSTNATNDYGAGFVLEDMPSDFGNMDTCFVRIRYAWDTTPGADEIWNSLGARVVTTTGTVLAAGDAGGGWQTVATSITTATATNSSNVAFGYTNTGATKAQWNTGIFEITMSRTKNKGGGTDQMRVYAAEINGTYTISTGPAYKVYMIT